MRQMQLGGSGVGMVLAAAALLVNGPRLVQIFLAVDGIELPAGAEATMLGLTGIATGIVLSGGGMYLAHTLALPNLRQGIWRWILAVIWLLLLLFSVILIAPMLVYGVQNTGMIQVLNTPFLQWGWAVVAVLAVEVLAAGAMVANALELEVTERSKADAAIAEQGAENRTLPAATVHPSPDRSAPRLARPSRTPAPEPRTVAPLMPERAASGRSTVQADRAIAPVHPVQIPTSSVPLNVQAPVHPLGSTSFARPSTAEPGTSALSVQGGSPRPTMLLERLTNGASGVHTVNGPNDGTLGQSRVSSSDRSAVQAVSHVSPTTSHAEADPNVRVDSKEDALDALVRLYLNRPHASYAEIAEHIGRGKSTVAGYVRELEEAGVLRREGNEIRVLAPLRMAAL